jgi:uncharacterized protein DUF6526
LTLPTQSYEKHSRYVPPYHFLLFAILTAYLIGCIRALVRNPAWDNVMGLLLAVALLIMAWYLRAFPIAVQNRLIRMEETLRLERLLPDDLRGRIPELSMRQLIGLRFASDAELPDLCRRALNEKLSSDAIKQQVKNWRPDHLRA